MAYRSWDPEEALIRLAQESLVLEDGAGDPIKTANGIIRNAAPEAALSLTHLALHSVDERIRMQASKAILDMTINVTSGKAADMPIEELLNNLLMDANTDN